MSRKFDFIPNIPNYEWIKNQMHEDLKYRLEDRQRLTSLGRPLYERINCQIIITQECPYKCPFCLERQHPMKGKNDFNKQLESLEKVLNEHPNARLVITGGEPSLYVDHVRKLYELYKEKSNEVFFSINTTLYNKEILTIGNGEDVTFNISVNDYVKPNLNLFNDKCFYQIVLTDDKMNVKNIKNIMDANNNIKAYSFRYLTELDKSSYDIKVFNEIKEDNDIKVKTFRVGDFFVYLTFEYNNKKARITLGDMKTQMENSYENGYSNIIIHPDGRIGINWR